MSKGGQKFLFSISMSTSPFLWSSSAFIWNGLLEKYEFYDSAQLGLLFEPQDAWILLHVLLKYAQTISLGLGLIFIPNEFNYSNTSKQN